MVSLIRYWSGREKLESTPRALACGLKVGKQSQKRSQWASHVTEGIENMSDDIPEIVDHLGETRKLGYVAPFGDGLKPRATRTNIQKIRTDAGLPALIPQDQWTEVDYVTGYPLSLITDQGQMGSCTAWSDVGGG